ncbi:MAG: hypothetical protein Q4C72_09745 [Eubacteriales bacterium]|nr:hypothetical protein [Eubacteriales bacterium]
MKLFAKKPADERVVAERNKTYKIGFYVFTIGILADILWSTVRDGSFQLFEWVVFMAAQIVCVALNVRKGIADEGAGPEAETFPLKRVLALSCLVGAATGVFACVVYARQGEWNALPPLQIAFAAFATCLVMFLLTTSILLALQAVIFAAAKARSKRMMGGSDEDGVE